MARKTLSRTDPDERTPQREPGGRTSRRPGWLEHLEPRLLLSRPGFPDLAVENLSAPPEALAGSTITVEYDLVNHGDVDFPAYGVDMIYAGGRRRPRLIDIPAGTVAHDEAIAPGESVHVIGLPLGQCPAGSEGHPRCVAGPLGGPRPRRQLRPARDGDGPPGGPRLQVPHRAHQRRRGPRREPPGGAEQQACLWRDGGRLPPGGALRRGVPGPGAIAASERRRGRRSGQPPGRDPLRLRPAADRAGRRPGHRASGRRRQAGPPPQADAPGLRHERPAAGQLHPPCRDA